MTTVTFDRGSSMDFLSALVGVSLVFWVAVGLIKHAEWFQNAFQKESAKIEWQQNTGSTQFSTSSRKLSTKKGFVFAYWDGAGQSQATESSLKPPQSPAIFDIAAINLVAFTSICMLVFVSKGFMHSLNLL